MPLSSFELIASVRFNLVKTVTGWADATEGENTVALPLVDLDLEVWNQCYSEIHTLAAAATATIDLRNFDNLLDESVVMTKALGIMIRFTHTDPTDTAGELTIGAGASDGFEAWFLPDMVIDAPTAGSVRTVTNCGDSTDAGVVVDGTHKTIDMENTGTDSITVTIVILGSTV